MNKQKFEAYLRDKLSILQEEEIDEIVAEYLQHIDMRVAEGVSEEEAIADFGDLNELVNDLLDAYKINRKERDFAQFENRFKLGLNTVMDFINRIANSIMKRSSNEVVSLLVEFIIVIFVVFLINSFIEAVFGGFHSAFYFRPYFLTNLIRFLVGLIRVVLSTTVSIAIFYWFAKERVLRNEDLTQESSKPDQEGTKTHNTQSSTQNFTMHQEATKHESVKPEFNEPIEKTEEVIEPEVIDVKVEEEQPKQQYGGVDFEPRSKTQQQVPKQEKSFMQKLMTFNILIIRVIVALCLIPGLVVGVFMGIGYVMLLVATLSGYGSLGLTLLFTGIILIYYYFTLLFIKFVGGKRA